MPVAIEAEALCVNSELIYGSDNEQSYFTQKHPGAVGLESVVCRLDAIGGGHPGQPVFQ